MCLIPGRMRLRQDDTASLNILARRACMHSETLAVPQVPGIAKRLLRRSTFQLSRGATDLKNIAFDKLDC